MIFLLSLNASTQIVYSDRNMHFDPVVSDFTLRNIGLEYSFKIKPSADDLFTVKWLNDTTVISIVENVNNEFENGEDYILYLRRGIFHDIRYSFQDSMVGNDTIIYKDWSFGARKIKSFEIYDTNGRLFYRSHVHTEPDRIRTYSQQYSYEFSPDTETVTEKGFLNDSIFWISKTSKKISQGLPVSYTIQTVHFLPLKKIENTDVFKLRYDKRRKLRKIIMYSETGKRRKILKMKYD